MKALVRLIKWLIITAVALAVLGAAGTFSYLLYSDAQANKALTERTNHSDWQWQRDKGLGNRRSSDVQWRVSEEGIYDMRRVYGDDVVHAYLIKTEDGAIKLRMWAEWEANCEDSTSIETSVTFASGKPHTLKCKRNDWGTELWTGVERKNVDLDYLGSFSYNFDGFEVDEDFDGYEWDFQPAVRHLTLQSAKPREETE